MSFAPAVHELVTRIEAEGLKEEAECIPLLYLKGIGRNFGREGSAEVQVIPSAWLVFDFKKVGSLEASGWPWYGNRHC